MPSWHVIGWTYTSNCRS